MSLVTKKQGIHLNPRTQTLFRPNESPSARVNQICDRYLSFVHSNSARVRSLFGPDEWRVLVENTTRQPGQSIGAAESKKWVLDRLGSHTDLAQDINVHLTPLDVLVLLELLELEQPIVVVVQIPKTTADLEAAS